MAKKSFLKSYGFIIFMLLGNAAVLLGGSFLRRRFRLILIDPNCKDKQLSGAS